MVFVPRITFFQITQITRTITQHIAVNKVKIQRGRKKSEKDLKFRLDLCKTHRGFDGSAKKRKNTTPLGPSVNTVFFSSEG